MLVEAGTLDWVLNKKPKYFIRHRSTILVNNPWNRNCFSWLISKISYIHYSQFCSQLNCAPLLPQCWAIYWSTETIVVLKWTLERGKCMQVNIRDFLRILYTRINTDQSPKWVPKAQAFRGFPGVCSLRNFLDVYFPKSPFLGIWVFHKGYLLTVQTTFQISSWEVFCFF